MLVNLFKKEKHFMIFLIWTISANGELLLLKMKRLSFLQFFTTAELPKVNYRYKQALSIKLIIDCYFQNFKLFYQ